MRRKQPTKKMARQTRKTNLGSALQSIYHDKINLETNQTCECFCCKVAMPQINYAEFVNIVTTIWKKQSNEYKVELICTSLDYFFKNQFEKWGIQSLVKPCMLLDKKTGLCTQYKIRPLNCRLYGLWPKDEYNKRVERFAKAYEPYGLSKGDLPLNEQCDKVKRVDESIPLTIERINELFSSIDAIDKRIGDFSELQVRQKENYRTFHDWLLLKVFGDQWLSLLTSFMLAATKEQIEDQVKVLKDTLREKYKHNAPEVSI